jgi:NAD(P)-dependent dehydrogenase (short-subunit alcohol dehydrogenase family)
VSSELKKIAFISSLAGSIAFRGSQTHHRTGGPYIYRTSKAALNASAKAIGFDQQANGVSVVVLHPGWVKTETGGWDASGNAEDSVEAMVDLIHLATPENNGKFLNFDGKELSW